jgi:AcrR family transcriptional regulator
MLPAVPEPRTESRLPSRSERRRRRTRDALVDAAREVFAAQGVEPTTIEEITEAADVAKGSFYNHFDSKTDVLRAVVETTLGALGQALERLTQPLREDPARVIAVSLRHTLRAGVEDPTLGWFLLRAADALSVGEAALGAFARRDLRRGIRSGRFRADVADLAGTVIGAGMLAVLRRRLRGELPPAADGDLALLALRLLGVPENEARAIASEKLSPLHTKEP